MALSADALAKILGPNQKPPTPDVFQSFLFHPMRNAAGVVQPDLPNPMQSELDQADKQNAESDQAQFEMTDPSVQAAKADALARTLAVPKLQAQNALDVEKEKTRGAQAVEQTKAEIAGKAEADKQAAADAKLSDPTNQIRTQATYAKNAMDLIGQTDSMVDDPEIAPYIGKIIGRMTGLGSENVSLPQDFALQITSDPKVQAKLGAFGFNLTAAISAIARAHNQRGATKELTQQFGSQMRATSSAAQLHGAFQSAHQLMQGYAANDRALGVPSPYGADPLMQSLTPQRQDPLGYGR